MIDGFGQNMGDLGNGLKRKIFSPWSESSTLKRLIYINIGIYLLIKVINFLLLLSGYRNAEIFTIKYVGLSSDFSTVLYYPWTVITYMFTHTGLSHILWNMLILYWFGKMFRRDFKSYQLLGIYLLGGIFGALFYIGLYNVFSPYDVQMIGASASVMAIVFAVCFYRPNEFINLFLIGRVKLLYIAFFYLIVDLLSIGSNNTGGHLAHIGGALLGVLFIIFYRSNIDITRIFYFIKKNGQKPKMKVNKNNKHGMEYEYRSEKKDNQEELNRILDKISSSGYDSLTKDEKATLFKSGK